MLALELPIFCVLSGTWAKLKPEYAFMNEIDAVGVGVWHGAHSHGMFKEYFLALAHQPARGTDQPNHWVTFCKASKPWGIPGGMPWGMQPQFCP